MAINKEKERPHFQRLFVEGREEGGSEMGVTLTPEEEGTYLFSLLLPETPSQCRWKRSVRCRN